ncbi:MAG: EutN/CcmL family microcompartment protein [Anaerolineae bacterium]
MKLGRVKGTLVATIKCKGLEGVRFLVVQELDPTLQPRGEPIIAADATATAGQGDLVYVVGGREAAVALPEPFVPVDHTIVGIVDEVDLAQTKRDLSGIMWQVKGKRIK